MKKTYRPLGTKVILRILPQEAASPILLPEGKQAPGQHQTFEVVAVGPSVNEGGNKLAVGEVVMIAAHASQMIGLDMKEQLMMIDREHIVCVVETSAALN